MPFYVNHTDGTSLVTLQDGAIDNTTTNLTLIGKNFPTYGQYLNQNLVTMLENSANTMAPDPALTGQIWYNSTDKTINFYREGSTTPYWQKIAMTYEGISAPTDPRLGDLWWDTDNSQLKLYDTTTATWRVIGPQTTSDGKLRVTGNNTFNLQVGGNTVLTVDNYGSLNLARNPCVFGYDNTSGANLTGTGVGDPLDPLAGNFLLWVPKITIDNGGNFTTSGAYTGCFTAPTAGIYQVYAHVISLNSTTNLGDGTAKLQWRLNDANCNINAVTKFDSTTLQLYDQIVCSGMIQAKANDIIKLVYATASDTTLSWKNSSYSIRLVG